MKTGYKIGIAMVLLLLLLAIVTALIKPASQTSVKQQDIGPTHVAANYKIQIKLDPEKPGIGNNQLTIMLRDAQGQPVTNAQIEMYAEMPAMGSMQAMREPVSIENSGSGLYQGTYSLPMNGSWPLTVTLTSAPLGKAELAFDMNTSRAGVKLMQASPSALAAAADQAVDTPQAFASFNVDSYRRQLIGVTTAEVICQNMVKNIRVGARVSYDQSRLRDVTLKYDAWVGELHADYVGKQVSKGETLLTVYSPELVSAQDEYLESLQQRYSTDLSKVTRKRLMRWGMNSTQLKALRKRGQAAEYLPIIAPLDATIIEKNVLAGTAVKAGASLLRLADLSTVWVEGEVYEADLAWLKAGMQARISLPDQLGQSYTADVSFIDPVLNAHTRTARVRVALDNTKGLLRPGMFANMDLQIDLGRRLVVPEQAVIVAGEQRIVFVDQGDNRLLPTRIKTGVRNKDMIEVRDGLAWGDMIVTSGNFLIAAESKLKAGLAQW